MKPRAWHFTQDDERKLTEVRGVIAYLASKYHLTLPDLLTTLGQKDYLLPVGVFTAELSVLETAAKYLKEHYQLNYHTIGELLGRDERNIWHTCRLAQKKHPAALEAGESAYFIPVSIFADRRYSALESLARFMRDTLGLTYAEIAELLKRDQRTIWTVYKRSMTKDGQK